MHTSKSVHTYRYTYKYGVEGRRRSRCHAKVDRGVYNICVYIYIYIYTHTVVIADQGLDLTRVCPKTKTIIIINNNAPHPRFIRLAPHHVYISIYKHGDANIYFYYILYKYIHINMETHKFLSTHDKKYTYSQYVDPTPQSPNPKPYT